MNDETRFIYYLLTDTTNDMKTAIDQYEKAGIISYRTSAEEYFQDFKNISNCILLVHDHEIYGEKDDIAQSVKEQFGLDGNRNIPVYELSHLLKCMETDKGLIVTKGLGAVDEYRRNHLTCTFALDFDPNNERFVPLHLFNERLVKRPISQNGNPTVIDRIPYEKRTPDMYLKAILANYPFNDPIPSKFLRGDNVLSFYNRIRGEINQASYNQINDLYKGKTIKAGSIFTQFGVKEDQLIKYNKDMDSIDSVAPGQSLSARLREMFGRKKTDGQKM